MANTGNRPYLPPAFGVLTKTCRRPKGAASTAAEFAAAMITSNAGAYHYLQFVAKSDAKDYPEYSDQIVGDLVAAGKPTRRTYAEKAIDEYVTEWIDKVDGRITAQGRKIVSKDRQTLTITVDGSSQVRIYDRQ